MRISVLIERSNRTFMELKWWKTTTKTDTIVGSNRTFMELKLFSNSVVTYLFIVLIAPLWN